MKYRKICQIISLIILIICSADLFAKPIKIVAAENFYAGVAKEIGGEFVEVHSILNNPNQDPHLFSVAPSNARLINDANIIVYNGIDYDPWMDKLLAATRHNRVVNVAQIIGRKPGDNPHIWYDPNTMLLYASTLTKILGEMDLGHKAYYNSQLALFNQKYQPLVLQVFDLKHRYENIPVIATEPVFNDMANAIGLKVLGLDFQLSMMNDVAPSAKQIKEFQGFLTTRTPHLFIYNDQVKNPVTERMQAIAQKNRIPIIGVSEMQPLGKTYIQWMQDQLTAVKKGLAEFN